MEMHSLNQVAIEMTKQPCQHAVNSQLFCKQAPPSNFFEQTLKKTDFQLTGCLSIKEMAIRFTLLVQLIPSCLKELELKPKTVDIGIRLFDYYCLKKYQLKKKQELSKSKMQKRGKAGQGLSLENRGQAKCVLVTCLFLAAKYNEIYPPGIHDFLYYVENNFSKEDELALQKEIVLITDFGFTRANVCDWYESLSGNTLPDWALMLHCHCLSNAERIARAVFQVQQLSEKQQDSNDYFSNCLGKALQLLGIKRKANLKADAILTDHCASKGLSE